MGTTSRKDAIRRVIGSLNAIGVGQLGVIETKLKAAEVDLGDLDAPELEGTVREARESLLRGDMVNFRRLIAQTVARLGHLQ